MVREICVDVLTIGGIIAQCKSPWAVRCRFPRKENGKLCMVHTFHAINDATIKSNYPTKRMEPKLHNISQPWVRYLFQADGINLYWAVLVCVQQP